MHFLLAQSYPSLEIKILNRCECSTDIAGMVYQALEKFKAPLVENLSDAVSVGVHIKKIDENCYEIFQTEDVGWVKNNFYHTHILTYSVVPWVEPTLIVKPPTIENVEEKLKEKTNADKSLFF